MVILYYQQDIVNDATYTFRYNALTIALYELAQFTGASSMALNSILPIICKLAWALTTATTFVI